MDAPYPALASPVPRQLPHPDLKRKGRGEDAEVRLDQPRDAATHPLTGMGDQTTFRRPPDSPGYPPPEGEGSPKSPFEAN